MKEQKVKAGKKWLYISTGIFSVVWYIAYAIGAMEDFDNRWSDLRLHMPKILAAYSGYRGEKFTFLFGNKINKAADPKMTISAIDDYTLSQYGWPVKRRYYGLLVDQLKKLGVKAIGVDVLLFEPDKDNPENDRRYVEAVARAGNVVNLAAIDYETGKIKLPLKGLAQASAYIAHPNSDLAMDRDGYVRKFFMFYKGWDTDDDGGEDKFLTYKDLKAGRLRCEPGCADRRIPSLGMATYAIFSGKTLFELQAKYGGEPLRLNYRYPVLRKAHPAWDKDPNSLIQSAYRHISVADIIEGRLSAEEKESLKGGITLLGATALGAFDHVPSPFLTQLPCVEVHATTIDNIIYKDQLKEVDAFWMTMLILILPWVAVFLGRYPIKSMVIASFSIMGTILAADIWLRANLYDMPFIVVILVFFLPFLYIVVDKGLSEGREKKWIKNTFGQYLSPKVVDLITKDPSKLSLGGEKREMTAYFLDMAGFTSMSEKMSPEELTAMLNEYLSAFTEVILKHDGTVDKYIGDCIVAFWNAPLDQADHRKLAVLAAVDCQDEMTRLNTSLTRFSVKPACRVGVNSGPMVVGNMGSRTRLSYTVMGDSVNLASRLEGANKFFHSKIMTSEETFKDLKDQFDYRYLGSIRVVGKAIPVKVYEPFARKGAAAPEVKEMLGHYETALAKFEKGDYRSALKDFKAALAARPGDGPSQFYIETCEQYVKEVPKDWDGSFNLTSKG
ncbi:MAG: adenylate/guanylate cyclase domain-containing protein [Elusimicrobia bacterium]|nr:adenylate/guanylate cyclase domain-containing protein [Elusimicrobiota bacterium]